jgi:hypothetical protein
MKKGLSILIAIGVCVLIDVSAKSQSLDQVTGPLISDSVNAAPAISTTDLSAKLAEARDALKLHSELASGNSVTLAVLDTKTSELELLTISKESFLTKGATLPVTSQSGRPLRVTVVRANGVNTAVRVNDAVTGTELIPLTVAFPIVKGGTLTEVAYYSSAHPAILSREVEAAGQTYVRSMLDQAETNLAAKGVKVPSDIVDIAEHLCVVEHTDHKRFMSEDHAALLPEIVSLYALNQGNTFRYSVSTAGAGGMIQMIPRTYDGIRNQHATVALEADFVNGMRDHSNALEAMLLYMNDTWTKLAESSEVQDALRTGIATKPELLAAGYNSNPGRLPGYLKTGGQNWRTLIPAETQMYLAIYGEVDRTFDFSHRQEKVQIAKDETQESVSPRAPRIESLITWVNKIFISNPLARML